MPDIAFEQDWNFFSVFPVFTKQLAYDCKNAAASSEPIKIFSILQEHFDLIKPTLIDGPPYKAKCIIFVNFHFWWTNLFPFKYNTGNTFSHPTAPPKLYCVCLKWKRFQFSIEVLFIRFRIESTIRNSNISNIYIQI